MPMAKSVNSYRDVMKNTGTGATVMQGNLIAYSWGEKLSDMVTRLEKVGLKEIEGAGRLELKDGFLVGTVPKEKF